MDRRIAVLLVNGLIVCGTSFAQDQTKEDLAVMYKLSESAITAEEQEQGTAALLAFATEARGRVTQAPASERNLKKGDPPPESVDRSELFWQGMRVIQNGHLTLSDEDLSVLLRDTPSPGQRDQDFVLKRALVERMGNEGAQYRAILLALFSDQTGIKTFDELEAAKVVCRSIHKVFQDRQMVEEAEFERSACYKRILRREYILGRPQP